jgi:hypothetical protein
MQRTTYFSACLSLVIAVLLVLLLLDQFNFNFLLYFENRLIELFELNSCGLNSDRQVTLLHLNLLIVIIKIVYLLSF